MTHIYLENVEARSIDCGLQLAKKSPGANVTFVCASLPPEEGRLDGWKCQTLDEIDPALYPSSWKVLDEILVVLRRHIDRLEPREAYREGLEKYLRFLLMRAAQAVAFARHENVAGNVIIISPWARLLLFLASEGLEIPAHIVGVHTRLRFLGRIPLHVFEYIGYAIRAFVGALSGPLKPPRRGSLAFVAQYGTQIEELNGLLNRFGPDEVHIHIFRLNRPMATRERKRLEMHAERLKAWGWGYNEYVDRRPYRALRAIGRQWVRTFSWLWRASSMDLAGILLRLRFFLERWEFELEDLLNSVKPKVLVVQEERDATGFITAEVANRQGCRVVNLFSGLYFEDDPLLKPPPFDSWFLWGEQHVALFTSKGVPRPRISAIGHLKSRTWQEIRSKRRQTQGAGSGPVIAFLSQPPSNESPEYRTLLAPILKGVLRRLPNATLIVKPHPSEFDGLSTKVWKDHARVQLVDRYSVPYELLENATVVVSGRSTVLLESIAIGIPIAVFDTTGWMVQYLGLATFLDLVASKSPVEDLVRLCSDKTLQDEYAARAHSRAEFLAGPLDGYALDRGGRILRQMVDTV